MPRMKDFKVQFSISAPNVDDLEHKLREALSLHVGLNVVGFPGHQVIVHNGPFIVEEKP
jgi:hypothetical protein